MANEPLKVDPNPSPKAEAEQFENIDERRRAQERQHELDLLDRSQGTIGSWIGSTDASVTVAFVILMCGLVLLGGSLIGTVWKDAFASVAEKILTLILTVLGFLFGKKTSNGR